MISVYKNGALDFPKALSCASPGAGFRLTRPRWWAVSRYAEQCFIDMPVIATSSEHVAGPSASAVRILEYFVGRFMMPPA